ncbi:hypothetical protein CLV84_4072 [Neolewinella xylanilytica]|uniref:Cytokinin riboside 5'-monophosphate phosphoribohydrolase n=1 Tax=Neolewinella xylanilytica TaxID=1514080 RepID=A0A2S6I0B0_9BACT|nr:TIGR00730 family Rossman fold protein [Neolewinella xylanilytica]PPK84303.1 hypothetical protein CLV84_4072 [Neolewinella xylanilytica]
MRELKSVAVFCGSFPGQDPAYADAARELAAELVRRDIRLVYGGGAIGLMGVIADEVLQLGGNVLGVIPQFLLDREVGHPGLTEMIVTQSMHERKLLMAENSGAFIAMPGGVGTLEEIVEVFTWTRIGLHDKPCGLLNCKNFYGHLSRLFEHMSREGFLRPENLRQLAIEDDAPSLLDRLVE